MYSISRRNAWISAWSLCRCSRETCRVVYW